MTGFGARFGRGPLRFDSSAEGPPLRNAATHFCTAATDTPNALATSSNGAPFIRSWTARSLYSAANSRPPRPDRSLFAILSPVLLTRVSGLGRKALGD